MNFTLVKFTKFQTRQKWSSFLTYTLARLISSHLYCFFSSFLCTTLLLHASPTQAEGWPQVFKFFHLFFWLGPNARLMNCSTCSRPRTDPSSVSSGNLIPCGSWSLKWHQPCCIFLRKLQQTGRRALFSLDPFILYPINLLSFNNNHCSQMGDFMF